MKDKNNKGRKEKAGSNYSINERIRAIEVRVVEGLPPGIYSTRDALRQAMNLELDLVEVSPSANPPVCKVIDFGKFLYEEKKRKKKIEDNQIKVIVKELKFTPNIGENDFEVKKKKAIEILEKGNKVKATVFFKGRNIMFKDRGELILARLANDLENVGVPESLPRMEGRNNMELIIRPKKTK